MVKLSTEDIEFLKHFALPDKEIAEKLLCSKGKVQATKKRVFARLNAANSLHALFKALKSHIITLDEVIVR